MAAYDQIRIDGGQTGLMRPDVEAKQTPEEMAPCVKEALCLSGALDALERAVSDLTMRLYQVLVPEAPEIGEADKTATYLTSPLHDSIRSANEHVGTLENRLHRLMGRLTI